MPSWPGSLGERVEDRHLRVGDRVGVVVAVDLRGRTPCGPRNQPLDLIQLPFDDVDRFLVQRRRAAREIGLADDARSVRRVDDHEVVRRDRPQADRVGRIRLVRPGPLPSSPAGARRGARSPSSASTPSTSCTSCAAELLARRERQLERRALHVIDEDVQVVGIDERVLRRRIEEIRRDAGRRTDRAARCWRPAPPPTGRLRRPARPARCQVAAIVPG